MLLIILLVNKFEREHNEKKINKQETSICKCVFSGETKIKSVSAVGRVMGRSPILFALQVKQKI